MGWNGVGVGGHPLTHHFNNRVSAEIVSPTNDRVSAEIVFPTNDEIYAALNIL